MTQGRRRRIVILGSTGSIGRQAIDVVRRNPDRFEIVGLAVGSNRAELARQAEELGVEAAVVGADAARSLAADADADIVLNAIVGAAGLGASLATLEGGKTLALANKESLVAAGELCLAAARSGGAEIVPVDSEHAALAQCLHGRPLREVSRIVLTASGGPFRTRADLRDVTPDEALAHPTWSMGPKITIDSATLMNKGLEVLEAHFLFGIDLDAIGVVVHPQSLVHALVELVDGSSIMQAAPADMRIPIQAALSWPERLGYEADPVDLAQVGSLTFEETDDERFPALRLAYEAGRAGGTAPAVLNAANECAVYGFLARRIAFTDIAAIVGAVLDAHEPSPASDLECVLEADRWSRSEAERMMADGAGAASRAATTG